MEKGKSGGVRTGIRWRREDEHGMSRKWKLAAAGLAGAVALSLAVWANGSGDRMHYRLTPDNFAAINGGVFEGWGTSLCWWANRIGYSDVLAEKAAEAFCDPEKGLGLNILRYNIGGGDDPAHDHIQRTDSMMPGYWSNPTVDAEKGIYEWEYDWTQDSAQRNVLMHCLKAGGSGMIVEGFSNSPPYFMTRSGCSSGARNPGENNLQENAYGAFARYLADVAEHFDQAWGIRFQSMSPMNEPDTAYWGAMSPKQEGCHFDPGASQSRMLLALSEELEKRNLGSIRLAGTDETSVDTQASSIGLLSDEALKALDRVDTHTYAGNGKKRLRRLALERQKNLWMSEVDGGGTLGEAAGEMGAGLWLANQIIDDLNSLTPSAWVLWQVIDSHISADGYLGRRDSGMVNRNGGYWGTAVADHDAQSLNLTMKYYVFGQFTRYIRPGSRLIVLGNGAAAAEDAKAGTLTIVAMNPDRKVRTAGFDLSAMGSAYRDGNRIEVIRTSGTLEEGEHWAVQADLALKQGAFEAELPGGSVTTFVVHAHN